MTGAPEPVFSPADQWTVDVARAGAALYWSLYYGKPEAVTGLPDAGLTAYQELQQALGGSRVRPAHESRGSGSRAP